jgi:DNA-binding NarL/FixJ family response regulator
MSDLSKHSIRIVILDHQTLIRAGLRLILSSHADLQVVGEAGTLADAVVLVQSVQPDVILLGMHQTGGFCLDDIPKIICSNQSRMIMITSDDAAAITIQAVHRGVLGVVLKSQPPEILIKAIQRVHAGEVWIERSLMANLINDINYRHSPFKEDPELQRIAQLSERERQIIQLIGRGWKNQQIANHLCISETTVRHHLTSVYSKLGVSDRLELLVLAQRCGLTKQPT